MTIVGISPVEYHGTGILDRHRSIRVPIHAAIRGGRLRNEVVVGGRKVT